MPESMVERVARAAGITLEQARAAIDAMKGWSPLTGTLVDAAVAWGDKSAAAGDGVNRIGGGGGGRSGEMSATVLPYAGGSDPAKMGAGGGGKWRVGSAVMTYGHVQSGAIFDPDSRVWSIPLPGGWTLRVTEAGGSGRPGSPSFADRSGGSVP